MFVAATILALTLTSAGAMAWDLWGSALYNNHEQAVLADELNTVTIDLPPVAAPTPSEPAPPDPAQPEPLSPLPPAAPAQPLLIDSVHVENGTPFGQILIPAIGMDKTFVYGTGVEELKKGPGLWKWGVAPGQPGNATISGHRTTYGGPFRRLHELNPGDRITVRIPGQTDAVYEVRETRITTPQDVAVTDQVPGVRLTLTACHPIGSPAQRIIVQAELVEGDNVGYAMPKDRWSFQGAAQ